MTTGHAQTFGALLKRYRLASGLTQAELAEQAGLSPEAVSALERGVNRTPRKDTVLLLADALNLQEHERALLESAARQHKAASAAPSSQSTGQPSAQSHQPSLIGRTRETALIQQVLRGEAPPAFFLAGEPGVGKTRLLREAMQQAAREGWTVLTGECQRQGGQTPYAPLLTTIERYILHQAPAQQRTDTQGCSWLVRLLPELVETGVVQPPAWTLPPEQERRLMFAAVARFLANIAGPAGTLLVLDDLHWADTDGCDLLATLIRSAGQPAIRVIGAYRDTEAPTQSPLALMLADLAHAGLATASIVPPLNANESADLLRNLLEEAEDDDALAQQVVRQAGGVPFYLVSWAQALRAGALAQEAEHPVPWDIVQSVRQRFAPLPEVAREVLGAAAVNGSVTPRALLVAVLAQNGRSEDEVITGLEIACQAKLLIEGNEDTYQFAHEMIRDVIAHDLSMARRATLHRRIAETLESEQGETAAAALAFHFARGGESARAAVYLERAGDRASSMQAHATAETYYHELVERLNSLNRPIEAAAAREKWGATLTTLARYDMALAALDQAAETYRAAHDTAALARVEMLIGQTYANQGSAREGLARLQPLLAASTADDIPKPTLAALKDIEAQLLHITGEYSRQLEAAQQAASYARSAGDELLLCQIEMRRGNALRMLGRMEEASRILEEVVRVAETINDQRTLSYALDNASGVYLLQGEFDKTVQYVERAYELMEPIGDPLMIALLLLRRGMNAYVQGDWQHARASFEQAREMTDQLGVSWVSAYTSLGLGQLCVAEGDWERATALLEESVTLAEHSGDLQALRWAQAALAEYDLLRGRPEAARARLEPLLDRPGQQEGLVTYLLPYLAWACLDAGDIEQARIYIEQCLERASGEHIRLAWVDALRVQALLALRQGDTGAAAEALTQGTALCQEMRYPYGEAKTRYTCALLHTQQNQPEEARTSLQAAQTILEKLGERLYRQQIEQKLKTPSPSPSG